LKRKNIYIVYLIEKAYRQLQQSVGEYETGPMELEAIIRNDVLNLVPARNEETGYSHIFPSIFN